MSRAFVILLAVLAMSIPGLSDTFSLAPVFSPNYADTGMITWTSPVNGTITVSGNAWVTYQTSDVTLEYVPASIASSVDNPGNGVGGALQGGTWRVVAGTVQHGATGGYYVSPADPAAFGTSMSIPCENGQLPCSGYTAPLPAFTVNKGDMIAAVIENYYMYSGDTAGLNLNVQISGDAQGSGGTLADPEVLTSISGGVDGTLDPSSSHSSDAFEFYWGGGDFGGAAATNAVFGTTSVSGGFASGLALGLFSFPAESPIGSLTVLNNSAASGSFDFGSLSAGNYVLQVTDLNSNDDPPYNIVFNGSIDPPSSGPAPVPEPISLMLVGTCLLGLSGTIKRRFVASKSSGR
jgi:hypothetical protein